MGPINCALNPTAVLIQGKQYAEKDISFLGKINFPAHCIIDMEKYAGRFS